MSILYSYQETRKLNAIDSLPNFRDMTSHMMTFHQNILHDPIAFQKFKEDNTARSHQRRVQSGENFELQKVTVEGCIFENNMHGPDSRMTISGVIGLVGASNELIISNSIFRNNTYTEPTNGVRFAFFCCMIQQSLNLFFIVLTNIVFSKNIHTTS